MDRLCRELLLESGELMTTQSGRLLLLLRRSVRIGTRQVREFRTQDVEVVLELNKIAMADSVVSKTAR